jgi:hypothetical protein
VRTAALLAPLAAALLALGAGCLSTSPASGPQPAAPEPPTVLVSEGQVAASGPMVAVGGDSYPFTVDPSVTLLLAEIQWEDPAQDLDLALASPSAGMTGTAQNFDHRAEGGSPGMPDSPHHLLVEAPEPGDWQATAFGNGAGAMVDYHLAVTLFHGETAVPDGYSALG